MTRSFLKCKDYTVTGEQFELVYNEKLDMLVTSPKPETKELGKYYESEDYISHTDGTRSLFEKVYQIVKKYALQQKINLIESFLSKKGNILDIGAGTGDFLTVAKKNNWNVSGVEPNTSAIELAQKKGVILDQTTSIFKDNEVDVITMWHVLEHVPDLDQQIKEIKRILKKGGYAFIAVPNFKSYDANYYKEFWAAYDVPRHLWHFSKNSIEKLFSREGFVLQKIKPMKFDSYYVSLLSEKYKNGKMNFIKAFIIGFLSNFKGMSSKEYSSHIYILKKE
ncbi:class I SAM-dependent methyltransferase [Aquimarina rhabdastrellae]